MVKILSTLFEFENLCNFRSHFYAVTCIKNTYCNPQNLIK